MDGDPQKVDGISAAALPDAAKIQIADGHRRVRAVQKAGLDLSDEQMARLAAITAGHRESLTPIEQARHAQVLKEQFDYTNNEVADTFGRSRSWVSNRLRLLKLPDRLHANIQSGDLTARQAQALMPIFEADLSDVTFPEGNAFAPDAIIEKALDGRSSDDLRRDVKQFESWVRQLKGETQKEVREQEYEQDLELNEQADGPGQDRQDDEGSVRNASPDEPSAPEAGRAASNTGGPQRPNGNSARRDVAGARKEHDDGESREAAGSAGSVGGDGAPTTDKKTVDLIGDVAEQIAEQIDQSVPTRHLIALGLGNPSDLQKRVHNRLFQLHERSDDTVRSVLSEWLDEMGYVEVSVPGKAEIGSVVPAQVDDLLGMQDRHWKPEKAEQATIPSLLVAHRVAGEQGRTWLSTSITQVVRRRIGTVTEDDVPDEVMADVRAEVEQRLEAAAA